MTFEQKTFQIIRAQLDLQPSESFTLDTTLSSLGADSLDVVELRMEFEEEFDVSIDDSKIPVKEDWTKLTIRQALVALVQELDDCSDRLTLLVRYGLVTK